MPDNLIQLMQEIVEEDLEIMKEVVQEDILPLIKYREQLERKAFEKAHREMKKLEEEVYAERTD